MEPQPPGIIKWIAGIRFRMENDPGRQDLDDHILCNGFLFLDEYLGDILTGTRTEPIIELTKTPGRRKDASKAGRSVVTLEMKVEGTANSPGPELSFIPEGDEIEASRVSLPHQPSAPITRDKELPFLVPNLNVNNAHARPSVVSNGTRTSWLNKARDVTAKRASVISGTKRKSAGLAEEPSPMGLDEDYARVAKIAKMSAERDDANSEKAQSKVSIQPFRPVIPEKSREQTVQTPAAAAAEGNSEGMMNILKRTVEGLGARVGKNMGKSVGGAAATAAAAEAKAAAEARLAQRDGKSSDGDKQGRLSVSDLISVYDSGGGKGREPEPIHQGVGPITSPALEPVPEPKTGVSTTPPGPPIVRGTPSLVATAATLAIPKFTIQSEPSLTFLDSQPSTQSTYVSSIFDTYSASPPLSQMTELTASQGFSQPDTQPKLLPLVQGYGTSDLHKEVGWTHDQPDTSVLHTRTINAPRNHEIDAAQTAVAIQDELNVRVPDAFEIEDEDVVLADGAFYGADREFEEESTAAMGGSMSSPPSDADMPKSKDNSSQPSSQAGFVAQASGLLSKVLNTSVGTALGASKRGKAEPVKSIQLAAMAAKKQQEEADKKAARLREMDKRRAAIASKKAEQEAAEKAKQQGDRRKRDREEGQEKKAARALVTKVEEEVVKKRKFVVEIEKPESKKPLSKDKKNIVGSRIVKPVLNTSQTQVGQNTLSKSFKQLGPPASATVKLVGPSQGELKTSQSVPKTASVKVHNALEDTRQPSQTLHAQMQARVEAQILQARQEEPITPSESIELPEINSEYSNSDDEGRPRTFDPPDWAQSPDLRIALESQSRMNPDDIFGPVRPLRMEEIFPTRQSRFRARTSSANWTGTDEVTRDEEAEYAKRMGYLD